MPASVVLLAAAAMLIGGGQPLQAGINSSLARYLGQPVWAALTNTLVASIVLLTAIALVRVPIPPLHRIAAAPWWAWTGGIIGAISVFGAITIAPKLGAASYISSIIAGTVVMSLVLDHFGLVGFREFPITVARVAGAALVIAGMLTINYAR